MSVFRCSNLPLHCPPFRADHGRQHLREFRTLATLHTIDGLMAWAGRKEWSGMMAHYVERHTAQALERKPSDLNRDGFPDAGEM